MKYEICPIQPPKLDQSEEQYKTYLKNYDLYLAAIARRKSDVGAQKRTVASRKRRLGVALAKKAGKKKSPPKSKTDKKGKGVAKPKPVKAKAKPVVAAGKPPPPATEEKPAAGPLVLRKEPPPPEPKKQKGKAAKLQKKKKQTAGAAPPSDGDIEAKGEAVSRPKPKKLRKKKKHGADNEAVRAMNLTPAKSKVLPQEQLKRVADGLLGFVEQSDGSLMPSTISQYEAPGANRKARRSHIPRGAWIAAENLPFVTPPPEMEESETVQVAESSVSRPPIVPETGQSVEDLARASPDKVVRWVIAYFAYDDRTDTSKAGWSYFQECLADVTGEQWGYFQALLLETATRSDLHKVDGLAKFVSLESFVNCCRRAMVKSTKEAVRREFKGLVTDHGADTFIDSRTGKLEFDDHIYAYLSRTASRFARMV